MVDFEQAHQEYQGAIQTLSRKYFSPSQERQDFVQEARIGLWKACQDYKPESGVPFQAFVNLCINRHLQTYLTGIRREKHQVLTQSAKLDMPMGSEDETFTLADTIAGGVNPEERYLAVESAQERGKAAKANLSPMELEAFTALVTSGNQYKDVKQRTPEARSIDNALERAKRKMRKAVAA